MFINTGPSQTYPAPYRAYTEAGFTPFVHHRTLTWHQLTEGLYGRRALPP